MEPDLDVSPDSLLAACLWVVPALSYLPLLTLSIPAFSHPYREIAGAFQALAYAEDGFGSLWYLTPQENLSGIHLHSLLSAPLVDLGYVEGGRLVSLLAAAFAAIALGALATKLFDRRVGLVAPLFLWTQPLFGRFAYSFKPESLSIALTVTILYLLVRFDESDDRRYWYALLLLVPIATSNQAGSASDSESSVGQGWATRSRVPVRLRSRSRRCRPLRPPR